MGHKTKKIRQELQQEMSENATPSPTESVATTNESIGSSRGPTPMLNLEFIEDDDFDDFKADDHNSPRV